MDKINTYKNISNREKELAELVDGAYTIIELAKLDGDFNKKWQKLWLEKARELVPGCDSLYLI